MTTLSTDQTTALSADRITTPKSNDSVELPIKDIKQLPTPSRTISPDLPKLNHYTTRTLRQYLRYN